MTTIIEKIKSRKFLSGAGGFISLLSAGEELLATVVLLGYVIAEAAVDIANRFRDGADPEDIEAITELLDAIAKAVEDGDATVVEVAG